jgi:hypothetical protein
MMPEANNPPGIWNPPAMIDSYQSPSFYRKIPVQFRRCQKYPLYAAPED